MRWLLLGAVVAGVLIRLPQLGLRPMHTDEAVHAVKFGELLESGTYRYDRNEYHGPTLNYLTLIPARVRSEERLSEVTESTLRCVPAAFGIGLLLLPLLLPNIRSLPIAAMMALTAVSPAMSFYSRYYIQEILLVFFTFALIVAAYRLVVGGRTLWALVAGVSLGLMASTKETWVISAGALVVSGLLVLLVHRRAGLGTSRVRLSHVVLMMVTAVAVAVTFFSSLFSHWQGVADSVLAYQVYVDRAAGEGSHVYPWYHYLRMLTFWRPDQGLVWSEAGILILGVVGAVSVWIKNPPVQPSERAFHSFLAFYAVLLMIVYSVIPYKTPWAMLGALHAAIVLAGFGVARLADVMQGVWLCRAGLVVLVALLAHLGWQAYRANYVDYENPGNPYVYAHTRNDVTLIAGKTIEAALSAPEGLSTPVQVIVPGDQYWPLPWYLRSLRNVGWWNAPVAELSPTAIILASTDIQPALLRRLYETPAPGERRLYVSLFERPMQLRPGIEIQGYVTLELRDRLRGGTP